MSTELLVHSDEAVRLKQASREWPSWDLTPRQVCDLELLLNGAFSPLESFMGKEAHGSVCSSMRLPDGTLWPIPVVLDVTEEFAAGLAPGTAVALRDAEGALVTRGRMPADMRRGGRLTVSDPALWWPRYMAERPGYLYTIEVEVLGADGNVSDVYRLPHGIRTVGTRADGAMMMMGDEQWRSVLRTGLDAAFYCCRAFVRDMIARRAGAIVLVSSMSAIRGVAGRAGSCRAPETRRADPRGWSGSGPPPSAGRPGRASRWRPGPPGSSDPWPRRRWRG